MGRRGPPANPNSVRYQDRRRKPAQTLASIPASRFGKAVIPKLLKGSAKQFWKDHAPALERRGLLTALDETAFASVCVAYAHMKEASEILQREGEIIFSPRGKPKQHPAVKVHAMMQRHLLWGLKQFGMTPASRARLNINSPDKEIDNEFEPA